MDKQQDLASLWQARIDDAAQSGMTVKNWCARHGYSLDRYYYWKRKLSGSERSAPGCNWLRVPTDSQEPLNTNACLTVRIAGAEIDLRPGFDPCLLRSVVRALGTEPC